MTFEKREKLSLHVILLICISFVVIAIIWAYFAVLDEVTTGTGRVISSKQVQIIQSLEGGIVEKILAFEGEVVQKKQKLLQIDNTLFLSDYNEEQKKIDSLELQVLRLKAEHLGKPFKIPNALSSDLNEVAHSENSLFESRQKQLSDLKKSSSLIKKEIELTQPLVARGAASAVEVIRLERTYLDMQGKINEFQSKTIEQLNESRAELNALKESHVAEKDRVDRTTIRSPVKGIINRLNINTIGGVLKPGVDILEIVPLDDSLLIEVKIRPEDIGFIHLNQKAMVKISAYDFSIYGGLEGKIEKISADTITEQVNGRDELFYLITVRTAKNHLGSKTKPLTIIPGMQASVDILTGEKTVLQYLLKPIIKTLNNAMDER